jgi:hypothetical protein
MKLEFFDGTSWYSVASENFVNTKVFDINSNTSGQLNINRLNGYPASSSLYLRGDGVWSSVSPTISLPLNLYTSNTIETGITIYNSNNSSTASGFRAYNQNTGYGVEFGLNNSTSEAYVFASSTLSLKFGTNGIMRMKINSSGSIDCQSNDILTSGNINAQTGTLIANNLAAYNSGVIVCANALSIQDTGTYKPYNGSYGYLSSGGNTGTSTGQNPYSINCNNRVKASEFNAVSSIKTKNIESSGKSIEEEALKIFNKIPFFKYSYKDKIKNGEGSTFGVIAEPLKKVLPDYVLADKSFVPNILQSCLIRPITSCSYELVFKEKLTGIEGSKLQLILLNKSVEVEILKTTPKRLTISSSEKLPNKGFAYGTFETCPSVTKNKLFELSMVVLKNTLKRVEILENKLQSLRFINNNLGELK